MENYMHGITLVNLKVKVSKTKFLELAKFPGLEKVSFWDTHTHSYICS